MVDELRLIKRLVQIQSAVPFYTGIVKEWGDASSGTEDCYEEDGSLPSDEARNGDGQEKHKDETNAGNNKHAESNRNACEDTSQDRKKTTRKNHH